MPDKSAHNSEEDPTVRTTISMPRSILRRLEEACAKCQPRKPLSRRIAELIVADMEREKELAK